MLILVIVLSIIIAIHGVVDYLLYVMIDELRAEVDKKEDKYYT